MMFRALVLVFSLGILQSSAQILQNGQCDPNIALVQNFNLQEFLGVWHEISRHPDSQRADCAYHQFDSDATTNAITYYNRGVNKNFLQETSGTVVSDNTARLILNLTSGTATSQVEFSILLTDYTNYAVGYRCENVGTTQRNVYLFHLGRTTTPTELITALIGVQLNNLLGVNISDLETLDHSEQACYVMPVIERNTPVILPGQCDVNMTVVQNFDVAAFTGVWHEIASYYSENALGECPRAQYTLIDGVVAVVNSQVINQTLLTISGNATVASTDGSARLLVILEVIPGVFAQQELLVIATDYTNYAITYTCQNIDANNKRVFSWIVARQRQLSEATQSAVNAVVDSILDLNEAYYNEANRSDEDCFYYPEHVPGQTVSFRGQCDLNIPAMPNFDPVRYMGLWHDVVSYPSTFQQGTCNNAFYTLVDGVVDVYNTQVVNQTLDTINGYAVLASDDGSAKLLVTFPVEGTNFTVTLNYWVLDTDYETYALVYTCENIDDESRLVFSWKLSRTKELPAAASAIIDNITSTIDVLDARYYETRDQSEEGCFYYPEAQEGVPVVFPGLCNETIAVVNNFDLNQFLGTWYEIQAYPKDTQGGQCINHVYTSATANTLSLQSSSVVDQFLQLSNSTVAFSSTDGSARLVISLVNSNGTQIEIPFWILATDYTDYALAYSCVNLNSDFRAIYSWKLSRARTLSNAANTAISTVIASNVVLDEVYFETIDHSDEACFYLPELAPGEAVILPGQCNISITTVQNFDAAAYQGLWHSIENYPSAFQDGDCNDATYTIQSDGTVLVYNTQVINQTLDTITGSAVLATTDGSAKLIVTFPNAPFPIEYWVLATDYTSYSLVYSCVNINSEQRQVFSWKLGRAKTLSENATNIINEVINSIDVLNDRYFVVMDNSDDACFYYPEADGTPVIFRGQCNESIPVVTNFDAVAYMGLWHDIRSYPSTFQGGSCNNAFYTLVDGVVDVYNTQVVNQTLDTINGVGVLATTDGSAKLTVTFPIAGTNFTIDTPYWVLATDYTSYSLVYTCVNINADYRQVWSWMLSRSKQLTAASETAINAVTSTIPVLDDRYYQDKDQSEDGCFYYPEPQEGVPVVFPGRCNESIPVVNNFDFSQFQGIWYEIEAYPKSEDQGQCISHQYTLGANNVLDLQSSSVDSSALSVSNSTVSFSSTDGSARLTITLTAANGSTIQIPFWILSTDYNDYALAYSCVNLNDDFRGVYSWKLSRTKSLSAAANTVINNAISSIVVLDNSYYEPIDQSDDACFYLPDLAPGEAVIVPGQCNISIPVVQNFDAAAYQGLWHSIENYPSAFQDGDCNDATYTIQSDGTVLVYNTQVINQTLDTITGSAVLATTDGSAKLIVTFPNAPFPIEYWVLATDYTSYSLVYSCVNINAEQRQIFSWKLGRAKTLSENATNIINEVINSINVLNDRYFVVMDNSDDACFYYPEADGTPVIFRGQCNESIPVVTNFDAVAYMGLWHDIRSYPSTFQGGSCNNAFYTLVDGVVDVYNTQVINQTLDTINGVGVLATTDGSAKLTVTFPIAGTNFTIDTPYWVLATDYTSYSLVYTCVNINADYRQVWSWMLSRSKQLAAASETAINAVTSTIPVLDDRYYQDKDQSEDGCFYYPEPQEGVPVVFPGLCNESIPVVNNFDFSQFQGIWYEIEAYPKSEDQGQCISHQYTLGANNVLDLQSSSVDSSALSVSNSTVSFSSTDGSARLTITLTAANGSTIQIPFWILSTDYNDYALAYSCVNLNDDFRGVYSWKLSRTKSLSAAANTVINNAILSIVVLDNSYYEPIDQSDDACFYLPDLAPGEAVIVPGQCNISIPVVQNFDAAAYQGLWHSIENYPSAFQDGDCNDATYTIQADGTVLVYNTQVINQTLDTITGSAVLATTDGSAKLIVTFPNAPFPIEYWVLATDYTSYSLVYSCVNINAEQRQIFSWKLGRAKTLSENATNIINEVINSINVLNDRYFVVMDNSDDACFYYPEADGTPVIFRGQCNESIPVVTNFDAVAYMGLWHDIRSYPSTFQGGSCNNAFYTLVDGTVDVYNTQVINQTLDTINGVGVLATTDGSAKLTVTFPIAGTNFTIDTPYWVLATDYTSYSLVYTCVNINADYRQVWSWMLSRSKQLAASSETAINAVTSTIPVLDDRYYQDKDQSEDGCFYYPEPQEGVPVVFPGRCNESIPVVNNFDFSQFQGIWYEIETYPKSEDQGQCISHQYTLGANNVLDLQSSSVDSSALSVSNSTVSFSSTDGSARLTITLTAANGSTIQIPFWVLSTDYNDYALAYSCVNLDDDFRGVYSWKLSRTKSLSAAANTVINNAISSIVVLDNSYYEPIDQSDDACFYLPDLAPGESVMFPGLCNPNVAVVQNFDAARYQGLWHLIEGYPSVFQDGDCNDATYTIQSDGTVLVYNTQVINQTLDTITGSAVLATTDGSAKLIVTFPTAPAPIEYWVLDTDYDSYALVYSCVNISSDQRQVWSWKMSRAKSLSANAISNINQVISTVDVLDQRYYEVYNNSDEACFYYPEYVPGQGPTFRGQCDENLAVVQNFDVARYLGLWYDIQSYPQEFQDGATCANALYTLGSDGVDVYNTQVLNQLLDTINGTAVVASTDGSAKLLVTFPIAGTTFTVSTPYWVLATDYDSYSLVYSCTNINSEYRRVTSWKLSRQQTLSTAAATVINNIVSNVDVLDERYFEETGQTEEDCFYYPDNFGGPVILDGQCPQDSEVNVVTNFNAANFAGTWHEISRFPSELQTGECSANIFNSTGTSTFSLTSTFIYDERLNTVVGSAVASADGRGILAVSLTGTDGTTNFNLYILDTDYTEFALAYGCVNRSPTTKQIYSWKLSRNRAGLSQAANDRIDQAVANHTDLHPIYYDDTDQSDYGCFYYPQYDSLPEIIILPGPCNSTIQAKANFDAAAYLGRWFEVARLPDPNQRGTCSRAEYSLGDNVVDVYNTQVIGTTLDIQTGFAVVSSVDGSGLLSVTFDVNGITFVADYYVLETDYTSFSLVYSCRNTTDGNRQVTSWKLSRNPTLTNESLAIMDTFITNTQGLIEEYFTPTSQSDQDCFYVPEVDVNSAPVFRGACQNVTGVANFNVEQYVGWWHEIERYPVDNNIGECISSHYQQSENGFVVVETNVVGNSADVNSASVTVSADGRITKTYSDGRVEESWVLATDYQTYSLLYSCETFLGANDDVYRRVWSAKHSKARQLTAAAQNAMNTVIEANEVLYPQFYQQVAQDDASCFHYPESTENRVTLPGQCDENIPTAQNFDIDAYTGTWYLVEMYPHPNISNAATCIGSRYSLSSDDEISVLSWVVYGGELVATEGSAVLADDNGKLIVTLPLSNDETASVETRILDTDYTTYSLVYTCENINEFQRTVSAYKLSRSRSLPASAATAINNYMAQREELHQPYFTTVTQSDECEEPSSGFLAKSSLVLVLACALAQMMF